MTATILAAEPQLFVTDLAAAIDFFTAKLDFTVAFLHGEPAFYAQVRRDGAGLNLRQTDGTPFHRAFREQEADALAATLTVDGIKTLFDEFRMKGVAFHQGLRTEPWGARAFIVADPDANLILFAGN